MASRQVFSYFSHLSPACAYKYQCTLAHSRSPLQRNELQCITNATYVTEKQWYNNKYTTVTYARF